MTGTVRNGGAAHARADSLFERMGRVEILHHDRLPLTDRLAPDPGLVQLVGRLRLRNGALLHHLADQVFSVNSFFSSL